MSALPPAGGPRFRVELVGSRDTVDCILARFDPGLTLAAAQTVARALDAMLALTGAVHSTATPAGKGLQAGVEHAAGVFAQLIARVERLEAEVAALRGGRRRALPPPRGGTP